MNLVSVGMTSAAESERQWRVDPAKCVQCGDCVVICPASVFTVLPPPCQSACPIKTEVASCVSLIKQGKFDAALASIKQLNPFPGITSRVCTHPCEKECKRREIDEPLAIQALERSAAEYGQDYEKRKSSTARVKGDRVAVIGAGPAGLMAAHDLAQLGYRVTIFESLPVAGGMLYVGIPEYRLPKKIIKAEIEQIENLGVEIKLNFSIGRDITLGSLFEQGYGAALLATGAHRSLKLQIPGETQFEGVIDALSFLRAVNLGHRQKVANKAIVVGGGNAAIDAARTLVRLGSREVDIVYRRTRKEMPAVESEIIEAERDGIKIHYLVAPSRVLGRGRRVAGLECIHTELGEPEAKGRRRPKPIAGSEFSMEADLIISAIGQKPDLSFLSKNDGLSISAEGLVRADSDTMVTNRPGIFAAGDNVTGPATAIDAMAAGKKAAVSIDRYLCREDLKHGRKRKAGAKAETEKPIWWGKIAKSERHETPKLAVKERSLSFDEVVSSLAPSLVAEEASRCLACAYFAHMDLASCCRESCRICEQHCWTDAITAY